ncbi:MAG TPA: FAD-binding oxidoreductase, partial [Spirochaetia bacterium]|nr:FAD-binding oxidoreductase [Spirochaetia bacterium]
MAIDHNAAVVAAQCRHYAMCKIDFLGTGLCPAAQDNYYVSYYPQGRMDIYAAMARGTLPVTPALIDIVDACDLCGVCDAQCYFVTQLRPVSVARALKAHVNECARAKQPAAVPSDAVVDALKRIVGERWATNDPAHLEAYADDPCPVSNRTRPRYVALPADTDEVRRIVRLCRDQGLAYAVRGNGSSVMGFVLSPGLVLDTARMKTIEFDEQNWCVRVGAGVSAFELQQAARDKGFRVNVAEPSALYCANLMCSGIFSLFSASYGTAADNILDAEFVSERGDIFRWSEVTSPNPAVFRREDRPAPGICTEAVVRLHPVTEDESAVIVPFPDMSAAVTYARDLARRGIGIGVGVLGGEYLSSFMAPTKELARRVREAFVGRLGVEYIVMVLGDRYALRAARDLAPAVFSADWMRAVVLGQTALADGKLVAVLEGMEGTHRPYE